MTIVIRQDGGIHMLANSDGPLDSLALDHGARAIYRVGQQNGDVRSKGAQG
jgi:hypothetical protein